MRPARVLLMCALAGLAPACTSASPTRARAPEANPSAARGDTVRTLPAASADASFMQDMIAHHAQALYMTRLVPARSRSVDVRTLAERIERSQDDEIGLMARWLRGRGHPVPDTSHAVQGHDMAGHRMPGMLSADELRQLAAARGDAFDRLFLHLMIRHHEGALAMVAQLLAAPGARDPEAYRFAADVDADQRAEIARMRRMLQLRGSPGSAH